MAQAPDDNQASRIVVTHTPCLLCDEPSSRNATFWKNGINVLANIDLVFWTIPYCSNCCEKFIEEKCMDTSLVLPVTFRLENGYITADDEQHRFQVIFGGDFTSEGIECKLHLGNGQHLDDGQHHQDDEIEDSFVYPIFIREYRYNNNGDEDYDNPALRIYCGDFEGSPDFIDIDYLSDNLKAKMIALADKLL